VKIIQTKMHTLNQTMCKNGNLNEIIDDLCNIYRMHIVIIKNVHLIITWIYIEFIMAKIVHRIL